MALAEIERARVRKAMDALMQRRRPTPHIRPRWRGHPEEQHESPVAKAPWLSARRQHCAAPRKPPTRGR